MQNILVLLGLAVFTALVAAQHSDLNEVGADYNPAPGEEYTSEKKAAKAAAAAHPVVVKETVVVKEQHPGPVYPGVLGQEARRVNFFNGYRQHRVNVKAVHHGASAGTAPEVGVPGTGFGEPYGRAYNFDYFPRDYRYDGPYRFGARW